jgi:hypothetical protein
MGWCWEVGCWWCWEGWWWWCWEGWWMLDDVRLMLAMARPDLKYSPQKHHFVKI